MCELLVYYDMTLELDDGSTIMPIIGVFHEDEVSMNDILDELSDENKKHKVLRIVPVEICVESETVNETMLEQISEICDCPLSFVKAMMSD